MRASHDTTCNLDPRRVRQRERRHAAAPVRPARRACRVQRCECPLRHCRCRVLFCNSTEPPSSRATAQGFPFCPGDASASCASFSAGSPGRRSLTLSHSAPLLVSRLQCWNTKCRATCTACRLPSYWSRAATRIRRARAASSFLWTARSRRCSARARRPPPRRRVARSAARSRTPREWPDAAGELRGC